MKICMIIIDIKFLTHIMKRYSLLASLQSTEDRVQLYTRGCCPETKSARSCHIHKIVRKKADWKDHQTLSKITRDMLF